MNLKHRPLLLTALLGLLALMSLCILLQTGAGAQAVHVPSSTGDLTHTDGTNLATLLNEDSSEVGSLNRYALRHVIAKAYTLYTGGVAQINVACWGDSVAGEKPGYFLPLMRQAYGTAGYALQSVGAGVGGVTVSTSGDASATAGQVTPGGGANSGDDYTYWPLGGYADPGTTGGAGVLTYQVSGGQFPGNTFKLYYATSSLGGNLTVQLQDGSNTVLGAQTVNTNYSTTSSAVAGGIVGFFAQGVTTTGSPTGGTFTLTYKVNPSAAGQTTAAIAYNASAASVQSAVQALSNAPASGVTVTGSAGAWTVVVNNATNNTASPASLTATASLTGGTSPSVTVGTVSGKIVCTAASHAVVIGPLFLNTLASGMVLTGMNRGGLQMNYANQSSQAVLNTVLGDLNLDLATSEMKDAVSGVSDVHTSLPASVARFKTAAANCDWLFIGTTPSVQDAGATDGTNLCLTQQENAVTKAQALANGYAYFDGYTPLVSYATVLALGWQGDGTHLSFAPAMYLGALMVDRFNLLRLPGAASPTSVNAPSVTAQTSLTVQSTGNTTAPLSLSTPAGGQDVTARIDRSLLFTDTSGNALAAFQTRGGNSYLPATTGLGATGLLLGNGSAAAKLVLRSNSNTDTVELDTNQVVTTGNVTLTGSASLVAAGKVRASGGLGAPMTTPSATTTTPTTVTKWMQVYDASGTSIGYVPVYAITP